VKLSSTLSIIPEPTGALVTSWISNHVYELSFTEPVNTAGTAGDIFVLDPVDCSNAYLRNLATSFPLSGSVKAELQNGGVAREYAIAQGKINELSPGPYRICYATKSSLGDHAHDFKLLGTTMILEQAPVTKPTLQVDATVALGADIIVKWSAGTGLDNALAAPGSWVGLYRSKECSSFAVDVHRCYLAQKEVLANTTHGTIHFNMDIYKEAGDYDVRYFTGDTRHGQGVVCRGLKEISETYLQCTLEESVISSVIFVDAEESIIPDESANSMPGLEAVFETGEDTYEVPGRIA